MFYSYKNIKIHYQVIGSGKPIFMIHGLDCDLNLMKGCFEPIFKNKNGYKRIYIDLPGMGKSEALLEYASSDKILDILTSFAENIISENFVSYIPGIYNGVDEHYCFRVNLSLELHQIENALYRILHYYA